MPLAWGAPFDLPCPQWLVLEVSGNTRPSTSPAAMLPVARPLCTVPHACALQQCLQLLARGAPSGPGPPRRCLRGAHQEPLLRRSIQETAGASIQVDFYWAISSNHTRGSNRNSHRKLSSKHVHVREIKKKFSRT